MPKVCFGINSSLTNIGDIQAYAKKILEKLYGFLAGVDFHQFFSSHYLRDDVNVLDTRDLEKLMKSFLLI